MRSSGLCVLVLLAVGCVAPATIKMKDGEVLEAVIEGGDARTLEVSTEEGKARVLERGEIEDIEHPSDMLEVGGTMLGVSLLAVGFGVIGMSTCGLLSGPDGALCEPGAYLFLAGGLTFVVGVPVTITGAGRYLGSRDRAVPSASGVSWSPLLAPDGAGGVAGGVGVTVSW
jgi:hypothetical protein